MNHKAFLSSLTRQQRKQLICKTNYHGLVNLILHFGAIVFFAWLIIARVDLWPLIMVLQGIAIVFLFTLLHETIHKTVFKTQWLNGVVSRICGFLVFLPVQWFTYFHFAHHRHTQIPGKDPELDTAKPETRVQFLLYVSGIPVWKNQIATLLTNAFFKIDYAFLPSVPTREIRNEARLMLLIYFLFAGISVYEESAFLLYVWIIPVLIGQPFLRLFLLAEHTACPYVSNMFENTRTTMTNALVRRITWNMPYHAEHHTYPGVPFHKLPVLHELVKAYLKEQEIGYVRFTTNTFSDLR